MGIIFADRADGAIPTLSLADFVEPSAPDLSLGVYANHEGRVLEARNYGDGITEEVEDWIEVYLPGDEAHECGARKALITHMGHSQWHLELGDEGGGEETEYLAREDFPSAMAAAFDWAAKGVLPPPLDGTGRLGTGSFVKGRQLDAAGLGA